MFNRFTSKPQKNQQRYRFGERLPVMSANALLVDKTCYNCIEALKKLSALPNDHFNQFYQGVINRFAEFVQVIPEERNAQLGSLLINGLLRGVNTLHILVTQFDNPSPLERYALFTACLLRDIGNVFVGQKIYVTDNDGATIKIWQPFCGPLTADVNARSYKIFPLSDAYKSIGRELRVTLARQIMGENGFLSIASDLKLLDEWLEALAEDDEDGSGRLVKAIKLYRRGGNSFIDNLLISQIEILDSPATEHADAFYSWLINGLDDGSIKVNASDSNVHVTDVGVFIEMPALFKDFAKLYNVPVNQNVVFSQFGNLMGIARKGGNDYLHTQLFSDYPVAGSYGVSSSSPLSGKGQRVRDGVLLADVNGVFINGEAPGATPHIKIPGSLKQSHQTLLQFNDALRSSNSIKNR